MCQGFIERKSQITTPREISHAFSEGFFMHNKQLMAENNACHEEIYRDNKAPVTHA